MSKKNKDSSFFHTPSLSQIIRWSLAAVLISILLFPPAVTIMVLFISVIAIMFVVTNPQNTMPTETPRDTPYQKSLKRAAQIIVAHYYNIPLTFVKHTHVFVTITDNNESIINAQSAIMLGTSITAAETYKNVTHAKVKTKEYYSDLEDLEKAIKKSRMLCEKFILDGKTPDNISNIINHHYHNIIQLADKIITYDDDTKINPQGLITAQEVIFDNSIKITY